MSITQALRPVVEAFESLGVTWHVGGSVASSVHGAPRATNDVDVVADLRAEQVEPLRALLGGAYYAPAELLLEAVRRRSCANLLHYATGYKIDVFVSKSAEYDQQALHRFVEKDLEPGDRTYRIATAEDIVLRKLVWYRAGGEVSDRQWSDVLGVLRVRRELLDPDYLRSWSRALGVADLLARAQREASGS